MYEVITKPVGGDDATAQVEARRSGLNAAFKVARKLHRDYRGQVEVRVVLGGVDVASDITECTMDLRKMQGGAL